MYVSNNQAEKLERQKAKELKKSRWWQNLIQKTQCFYCGIALDASSATMDHIVPISEGGKTTKGNVVPACRPCNAQKKSHSIMDWDGYMK